MNFIDNHLCLNKTQAKYNISHKKKDTYYVRIQIEGKVIKKKLKRLNYYSRINLE